MIKEFCDRCEMDITDNNVEFREIYTEIKEGNYVSFKIESNKSFCPDCFKETLQEALEELDIEQLEGPGKESISQP